MRTYEQQSAAIESRIKAHNRKRHRISAAIYSIAAVLVMVGSLTVTYDLFNAHSNNSINDCVDNATKENFYDESVAISENYSKFNELDDIKRITSTRFFGNIKPTSRSQDEIQKLAGSKSGAFTVYEDNAYLYFFCSDGTLDSILNISNAYNEILLEADKKSIVGYAEKYIRRYFPDFSASDYSVSVDHSPSAFPAWDITFESKSNCVITEQWIIRFVANGDMYYLNHSSCDHTAKITVDDAVSSALKHIADDYGVDITDARSKYKISASITPDVTAEKDASFYTVTVENIPFNELFNNTFWVKISADDGTVISIDQCK